MITYSVFQYMINDNVIFRAHMKQLVQDNPLNVENSKVVKTRPARPVQPEKPGTGTGTGPVQPENPVK